MLPAGHRGLRAWNNLDSGILSWVQDSMNTLIQVDPCQVGKGHTLGCGPRAPTTPGAGQGDELKLAVCVCLCVQQRLSESSQLHPDLQCRHPGLCCQHWRPVQECTGSSHWWNCLLISHGWEVALMSSAQTSCLETPRTAVSQNTGHAGEQLPHWSTAAFSTTKGQFTLQNALLPAFLNYLCGRCTHMS